MKQFLYNIPCLAFLIVGAYLIMWNREFFGCLLLVFSLFCAFVPVYKR